MYNTNMQGSALDVYTLLEMCQLLMDLLTEKWEKFISKYFIDNLPTDSIRRDTRIRKTIGILPMEMFSIDNFLIIPIKKKTSNLIITSVVI